MNPLDTFEQKIKAITGGENDDPATIYGVGALLGLLSVGLAIVLFPFLGASAYFLSFFPAVVISSYVGRIPGGLLSTIIAALGIDYLFLSAHNFIPLSMPHATQLFLLLVEGLFISFLLERSRDTQILKEYKHREKEYVNVIVELKKQNDKAKAEIRARDEFLSIASHELKTPLTSMLMQIQRALHNIRHVSLAEFSVENLLKMLDSAEQQSKRLTKMINDLLNVSLITTGRIGLEKEPADLGQIVKQVLDSFSERLEREGIKLQSHIEPVNGTFDALRIEQVVTNLLTNAIRYGDKKPISVTVERHKELGVITVKDNGIGIPKDQQERIFNRFERGVKNQDIKGLGVGLYITNQIVKAHGGTISVASDVGHGTTFTVQLPLHATQKLHDTTPQRPLQLPA